MAIFLSLVLHRIVRCLEPTHRSHNEMHSATYGYWIYDRPACTCQAVIELGKATSDAWRLLCVCYSLVHKSWAIRIASIDLFNDISIQFYHFG